MTVPVQRHQPSAHVHGLRCILRHAEMLEPERLYKSVSWTASFPSPPRALLNASPRVGCPPLSVNFNALSPGSGLSFILVVRRRYDFHTTESNTQLHHLRFISMSCWSLPTRSDAPTPCAARHTSKRRTRPQLRTSAYHRRMRPLTTQFTDGTVGANGWAWDFGDGSTSRNKIRYTYSTPGFYTVSLPPPLPAAVAEQTIRISPPSMSGGYAGFTHSVTTCPPLRSTIH